MASKKKIHPLDAADREAVGKAVSFNCHLRLSPSAKINEPAATLTEAAAIVDKIRAAHPGRSVLVYAIMPNGHIPAAVPVPQDMITAARAPDFTDEGEEPTRVAAQEPEAAEPVAEAPAAKPKREREPGKRAAIQQAAERGELPAAPDFSAPTHARFRKKLEEVIGLVEAGDIAALRAIEINPISSSPKAIARYRDLAVIALEARVKQEAA